jgi:rod shape-determining protein MreD
MVTLVRDETNIGFSVVTTLVAAGLLFQAANSPDLRLFVPRFLELAVCYWVLASPSKVGIIFAFGVGVLINLIEGSYIGSASIGLCLAAYVLLNNIFTIRQLDWISQTVVIFLLVGISVALQRVVLALFGVPSDGLSYLIPVLLTALIWRPSHIFIDRVRFRMSQIF